MRELLDDLAWRLKPSLFARRCSVLRGAPDPGQIAVLDSVRDCLLLCTRQWGKSSVTAVKATHHGGTTPEAVVPIVSPTERQSIELLIKIRKTIEETGIGEIVKDSVTYLELANGARYFALPGSEKNIRGLSAVTLLIADEAARISRELFEAVGPMLAISHGQALLLSSAWYKLGFFYEECISDSDYWQRFVVPADKCPRITPEYLERERQTTFRGRPKAFRREYFCEWQDLDDAAVNMDWINLAIGKADGPTIQPGRVKYNEQIPVLLGGV